MKKTLLYGPIVLQLLSAVALIAAGLMEETVWISLLYGLLALAVTFAGAFVLGRQSVYHSMEEAIEWMPKSIHVNEDEQGKKVAIIEQHNGNVVSLELPEEIDNSQDAMRFIISALTPPE